MPVTADKARAQFRLDGSDFEPNDLAWDLATPGQRTGYWRHVAGLARDAKYAELAKGIDVTGATMPSRMHSRHDHATGRVLIPHWSDSRFETELRWAGSKDGAVLWWKAPWSRIVKYHAEGIPSHVGLVVRDVIGLTEKSADRVRERARKWWAGQVATGRLGEGRTEMAGVKDAVAVAQAKAAGSFSGWHRVPPPRPAGSPFAASMPPKAPPLVRAPALTGPLPPWTVLQRLAAIYEAAGRDRTTRAEIEETVRRLGRSQSLDTLRGVLLRWGVAEPASTKRDALRFLFRVLIDRLRSAPAART